MSTAASTIASQGGTSSKNWVVWVGRALSALPALALVSSAAMKLTHAPQFVEMMGKFGFPESALTGIGILELSVSVLYLVPQTSILGAILVTGYLGGAVATHVRVAQPFIAPLLLGVLAWAGVFFRDERIRALIPLRRPSGT